MSTRSRARPWFARQNRLEGYAVEIDRAEEAGHLRASPLFPGLLCARDFGFERAPNGSLLDAMQWMIEQERRPRRPPHLFVPRWLGVELERLYGYQNAGRPSDWGGVTSRMTVVDEVNLVEWPWGRNR